MNSMLCGLNDSQLEEMFLTRNTTITENGYATVPVPAVKKSMSPQPDEEELHTSFEEAISKRLFALHNRLSRLSNPILEVQCTEQNTDTIFSTNPFSTRIAAKEPARNQSTEPLKYIIRPGSAWRRPMLFASLATTFMLLGFDLMGLLVLHMH